MSQQGEYGRTVAEITLPAQRKENRRMREALKQVYETGRNDLLLALCAEARERVLERLGWR